MIKFFFRSITIINPVSNRRNKSILDRSITIMLSSVSNTGQKEFFMTVASLVSCKYIFTLYFADFTT